MGPPRHSHFQALALLAISFLILSLNCARAQNASADHLVQLAREHFESDVGKQAFNKFFLSVQQGKEADFMPAGSFNEYASKGGNSWGPERTVKAEWIVWLCKDPDAEKMVQPSGIEIKGAKIDGEVELAWLNIPFPLRGYSCYFTNVINLYGASVRGLTLKYAYIKAFNADNLTVEGKVDLFDFEAEQPVSLRNARVTGEFYAQAARFYTGALPYNGFIEPGLDLTSAKIGSTVDLFNARVNGEARLDDAEITGSLKCEHGTFGAAGRNANGTAFSGASMKVTGDVSLLGFSAEGPIVLSRSTIGGSLNLTGANIHSNGSDEALDAASAKIDGDVIVSAYGDENTHDKFDFRADQMVSFFAANIGGTFKLSIPDASPMLTVDLPALDLRDAKVRVLSNSEKCWPKNLRLQGFVFDELGSLECQDAKTQIKWLRLQSPFVIQSYEQMTTVFRNMGLDEERLKVSIAGKWDEGIVSVRGILDSIGSAAKAMRRDAAQSMYGRAFVHGLQLIESAAQFLFHDVLWIFCFGWLIQYGYRPWNALYVSIGFVVLGRMIFRSAEKKGILKKKDSAPPRRRRDRWRKVDRNFSASIYSLETFVPLVKLGVAEYWKIDANVSRPVKLGKVTVFDLGVFVLRYYWIHIIAGWVFTSLWVAAFTGILKH